MYPDFLPWPFAPTPDADAEPEPVPEPRGALEPPRRPPPTAVAAATPPGPPRRPRRAEPAEPAPLEGDPFPDVPPLVRRVACALLAPMPLAGGLALAWRGGWLALAGLPLLAVAAQLLARARAGVGLGAAFGRAPAGQAPAAAASHAARSA